MPFAAVRGIELYHEVHGDTGPYVLFVHGILSGRSHWLPNVPAFVAAGYRPVVVELLGHGRSPAPPDAADYAPDAYVAMFERLRESLGAERWYVVGQSLGGSLTLRYALERPERVVAQAFTNSNSALAGPERIGRIVAGMQQQAEEIAREGRAVIERHRLNPARSRSLSPEIRAALAADAALHDPRGIALTGVHTVPYSSVRERIGENVVPTLLVAGTRETQFEPARRYAETCFANLEVTELDAGHAVNLHRPEAFNEAVLAFFMRHGR
jgi:pimeloyl-ACP methyl ester carboxylesterase